MRTLPVLGATGVMGRRFLRLTARLRPGARLVAASRHEPAISGKARPSLLSPFYVGPVGGPAWGGA